MPEVDMVNHPPHYSGHPSGIECIEIVRGMSFDAGNAVKYIYRAARKNGRQDIEKARWYLLDAIKHGEPAYVGSAPCSWDAFMRAVARTESDPQRIRFFTRVRIGDLPSALTAVDEMLAAS